MPGIKRKIRVSLKEKSYDILIGNDFLNSTGKHLKNLSLGKKILIVTQNKIPRSFLNSVKKSLESEGFKVFTLVLHSGEQYKNLDSLLKIIKAGIENKFERKDTIIALGGGVVSDLTGFSASIYYRGINFICIPTTLLSMVDAAIGGKTSINIPEGKNLLGTFYQPKRILIDSSTLKTLPKSEFLNGMAEVIKYALLEKTAKTKFSSSSFFNYLSKNRKKIITNDTEALLKIISYSAYVKAQIVSKDEKESNLRAILNLGHTFAHGIEQAYNYKTYTHGFAVSIGMCLAGRLSAKQGLLSKSDTESIIKLISDYGLPTHVKAPLKLDKILKSMLLDKKVEDGKLRFILPDSYIGKVVITSGVSKNEIKELFTLNS